MPGKYRAQLPIGSGLYWDAVNKYLGVGVGAATPGDTLHVALPAVSTAASKHFLLSQDGETVKFRFGGSRPTTAESRFRFAINTRYTGPGATETAQDDATKYSLNQSYLMTTTGTGSFLTIAFQRPGSVSTFVHTTQFSANGRRTFSQSAETSGSPILFDCIGGAHTTLAASVEANDIYFNLGRTVQFAEGALATQRAIRIAAPTYAFVGASVLTDASTVYISGAPAAGANATITNAYALFVDAGLCRFDGNGTDVFELPADATAGVDATIVGRVPIRVGGATKYLRYFND